MSAGQQCSEEIRSIPKNGWESGQDATQEIKCGFFPIMQLHQSSKTCPDWWSPESGLAKLRCYEKVDFWSRTLGMVPPITPLSSYDITWGTYRKRLLTQMSAYDNSSKPVKRMMRSQDGTVILEFTGLIWTGNPTIRSGSIHSECSHTHKYRGYINILTQQHRRRKKKRDHTRAL